MTPERLVPSPGHAPILALGGPIGPLRLYFLRDDLSDPLASFPSLRRGERPYNCWLSEEILNAFLKRWLQRTADPREGAGEGP